MARLTSYNESRVRDLISLYPHPRSALIPALHVLQEQDGYLSEDGMEHLGEVFGLSAAEVRGTASFYDMFHTEPVGKYLVAVCTNIACMLQGAYELLEHIEERLGVAPGGTTTDGRFTLEDAECLALCGNAPCLTVNWRFFGDVSPERFDHLVDDLAAGKLDDEVPPHGTLSRVPRSVGLQAAGRSVNGAGGPPSAWGSGDSDAGAEESDAGADEAASPQAAAPPSEAPDVRLETRFSTTAVVSLDGGRARQELGPQTPLRQLDPSQAKDAAGAKDSAEAKDGRAEAGDS